MKKYFIILFFLFAVTACKKTEFEHEGPTDVRIENISDQDFTGVTVKIKDESFIFGNIAKLGGLSEYHRFQVAYIKAEITALVNGVTFSTAPFDYTYLNYQGQMKLTYVVWISDFNSKRLEIKNLVPEGPLDLK